MLKLLLKSKLAEGSSNDMSRLPADVLKSIKTNIRKGAEDLNQNWANALELVHRAYEIEGAQRPSPDMETAWKQYEENLQYAVEQLAKNRGMDGDWRMSAAMFHEARQPKKLFSVIMDGEEFIAEGTSAKQVMQHLTYEASTTGHSVKLEESEDGKRMIFHRFGVHNPLKVTIKEL